MQPLEFCLPEFVCRSIASDRLEHKPRLCFESSLDAFCGPQRFVTSRIVQRLRHYFTCKFVDSGVTLSTDPRTPHSKLLTMGSGIFLLVFSLLVVVLNTSNFLAFGLAFFVVMIGIMLVMVGALDGMDSKKKNAEEGTAPTRTEIVREIIKVRCKYCNSLNFETSQRCNNCGAQL